MNSVYYHLTATDYLDTERKKFRGQSWNQFQESISKKHLVLFGSGGVCKEFLMEYGERFPADQIVDNNPEKWGIVWNYSRRRVLQSSENIPGMRRIQIISPGDLKKYPPEQTVILITSTKYANEIADQLDEMGFERYFSVCSLIAREPRTRWVIKYFFPKLREINHFLRDLTAEIQEGEDETEVYKRASILTDAYRPRRLSLWDKAYLAAMSLLNFWKRPKDLAIFTAASLRPAILRVKSWVPGSQEAENKKKIKSFKGKHQGERCFIIGNGPSLRLEDLKRLKGEWTFAINNIFPVFEKVDWRPAYYVCLDAFFMWTTDTVDLQKKVMEGLDRYKLPAVFLSDTRAMRKSRYSEGSIHLPTCVNWGQFFETDETRFSKDCSKVLYHNFTTICSIVQLAAYMGFTDIYFLGIDCNYFGDSEHFYDKKNGKASRQIGNTFWLQRGFYNLKQKVSEVEGLNVYNATRGGALELFKRVNLDSLLPGFSHSEAEG